MSIGFVAWEKRASEAMLPWWYFRSRTFDAALLTGLMMSARFAVLCRLPHHLERAACPGLQTTCGGPPLPPGHHHPVGCCRTPCRSAFRQHWSAAAPISWPLGEGHGVRFDHSGRSTDRVAGGVTLRSIRHVRQLDEEARLVRLRRAGRGREPAYRPLAAIEIPAPSSLIASRDTLPITDTEAVAPSEPTNCQSPTTEWVAPPAVITDPVARSRAGAPT